MTKLRKNITITSKSLFSEDLIGEVLRILEAKSVLRFRCVSKSWNSIISDPSFARLHLKRSRLLLLFDGYEKQLFRTADYEALKLCSSVEACARRSFPFELTPDLIIWGACNGILCFGVGITDEHSFIGIKDVNLWNPTTGEVYFLPQPRDREGWDVRFGFGWDKSANDYKVVRVLSDIGQERYEVEVLALKSKTWVEKVGGIGVRFRIDLNKIIYCNGALHWMANAGPYPQQYFVARFDLADEEYQKLLLPPLGFTPYQIDAIGVIGDSLCLCFKSDFDSNVEVWVMKEYGVESSWTKLTTIIDTSILSYVPLSLTTDGRIIGIANRSFMVKTNTNSGVSTKLIEERRGMVGTSNNQIYDVVVYEESLVSLMTLGN